MPSMEILELSRNFQNILEIRGSAFNWDESSRMPPDSKEIPAVSRKFCNFLETDEQLVITKKYKIKKLIKKNFLMNQYAF